MFASPHIASNNLLRLTLDFEELSCPAASPRANPHKPDATKAPAKPLRRKNQAPFGRPGRARAPVPTRFAAAPTKAPAGKAYNPTAPDRVQEILQRLNTLYPDVTCALHHKSAWELLVATILSAQSTDVRVNMVTPELFRKYPTVQDFAALTPEQLQPDVRSTGFFRNKSKSVVGAAKKIVSDFGGQVPDQMDQLLTLPGVARKTANVVLGTWFRKNEGVVVDTHVHRISRRLELTRNDDPKKIEQDLMQDHPARKVDAVLPPDHLARPQTMHRPPPQMRRLPAGKHLPRRRQDLEHGRDPQERQVSRILSERSSLRIESKDP